MLASLTVLLALTYAHDEHLKDVDGNYNGRGCGTESYNAELLENDATWQQSLDDFEIVWQQTQQSILDGTATGVNNKELNIPMVFHIVSTNPSSIPDSAVYYQLNVLNEDFQAENDDYTSGTPPEFRNERSGDWDIEYTVQQIIRVTTSVNSFSTNNAIKYSANGGSNVVNPSQYLNFWVGVLSGGVLGYAQFPGGSSATDGVVCAPGTLSPAIGSAPYNLGRTGTHELGHWYNLRHIWGDNSGCTNTQIISDFVTDTPPSSSANYGCPTAGKKCIQNDFDTDMYMNYMDYVEDHCMVMFSDLQKERAWTSIYQYREGMLRTEAMRKSEEQYVNGIYFTRFEEEIIDDSQKCISNDHVLIYDNTLNEGSNSNIFIYGCATMTNKMAFSHLTDIQFTDDLCNDEYSRASQDLNEGNDGDSIYLCYKKEISDDTTDNMAILDIKIVRENDVSIVENNANLWEITETDINPNGVQLNFAVQKAEYYTKTALKSSVPLTTAEESYIGVGVVLFVAASILIGFVLWRNVCNRPEFKKYMTQQLADEYGATTEMANVEIK